jgi:hypothetical protein
MSKYGLDRLKPSKLFHVLMGEGSTTWSFYRCVAPQRFHVIEVTDMDDTCGRDNDGRPTFVVELNAVDLAEITLETVDSALRSCGWSRREFSPKQPLYCTIVNDYSGDVVANGKNVELCIVECLHSYGSKARLESWEGNGWKVLVKKARAESRSLDDEATYEERMSRPVNRLGSSAREYMQGDLRSAMYRGVQNGDQTAKIIAKMHGATDESITAVESTGPARPQGAVMVQARLQSSEADAETGGDPLPYLMGYTAGVTGQPAERGDDYAPQYKQGYDRGVRVRSGDERAPTWIK